jgi:ribose transport system substrate-binding protein
MLPARRSARTSFPRGTAFCASAQLNIQQEEREMSNSLKLFVSIGAIAASSGWASAALAADTVAYIPGVQGDSFFTTSTCGAIAAGKELGFNIDLQVPSEFSAQAEQPILSAVIANKPKGIIVFPDDPVGITAKLKEARAAGILVHTLSADIDDKSARSFNLHQDLGIGGELAGQEIAKVLGKGDAVFVINVKPGIGTTDAREAGFKKAATAAGLTYVGQEFGENDPTKSAQKVSAALTAHPEIKGIYATNIFAGEGAVTAVKQLGLVGKVTIVMHDTADPEVAALKDGTVYGLIGTNAYQYGYQAVTAMSQEIGGKTPSVMLPPEKFITKANLNDANVQQQYVYKDSCS